MVRGSGFFLYQYVEIKIFLLIVVGGPGSDCDLPVAVYLKQGMIVYAKT